MRFRSLTPREILLRDRDEAVMHLIENTKLVEYYVAMNAMHETRLTRIATMLEQHPQTAKAASWD